MRLSAGENLVKYNIVNLLTLISSQAVLLIRYVIDWLTTEEVRTSSHKAARALVFLNRK